MIVTRRMRSNRSLGKVAVAGQWVSGHLAGLAQWGLGGILMLSARQVNLPN